MKRHTQRQWRREECNLLTIQYFCHFPWFYSQSIETSERAEWFYTKCNTFLVMNKCEGCKRDRITEKKSNTSARIVWQIRERVPSRRQKSEEYECGSVVLWVNDDDRWLLTSIRIVSIARFILKGRILSIPMNVCLTETGEPAKRRNEREGKTDLSSQTFPVHF